MNENQLEKKRASALLPQSIREALPTIGATEEEENPLVRVKFFYPDFSWTWYGIEFDGNDLFYGLVDGVEKELGYFRLSELLVNRGKYGCEIERDLYFAPTPLTKLLPRRKQ
jgi:hypothetical protein